jgi:plastocyanin
MSVRRLIPLAALAALAGAIAAPLALADNQAVVATIDNRFVAKSVAVKPGETVTFTNQGGDHNVVWDDGREPAEPPTAVPPQQWTSQVARTFARAGTYRYFCVLHGSRGGFGMAGVVYVNAAGVLPPVVSGLTASATRRSVSLAFRSTRAGQARATFFRRSGRRFVRSWAATLAARRGRTSRRINRMQARGSYRVEVVVTDAAGVRSEKRSRTFTIR